MWKKIKNFITVSKLVFLVELIVVFLVSGGFWPKDAFLFLSAFLVFYFLFEKTERGIVVFIASIPLFVALPLSDAFDQMANWRFFIIALFVSFVFQKGFLRPSFWRQKIKEELGAKANIFEILGFVFLIILFVSLLEAESLFWGLKKIAFLVNIFLLYPIIKNLLKENKEFLKRILKSLIIGALVVLGVGWLQLIIVFLAPLFTFWQFWTFNIIDAFYGSSLADLLSRSNTWFSYYEAAPPTLRLFSVFPDSHSFSMFLILSLPAILALGYWSRKKWLKAGLIFLSFFSFLGIVLSGSRGAWLSFLVAVIFALLVWFVSSNNRSLANKNLIILGLFVVAFGSSFLYPSALYVAQSYQEDGEVNLKSLVFFERAKSISNISETSNRGRIEIWDSSLKSIAQKPFLGVGVGNFSQVLGEDLGSTKRGASAHNLYLDFGTEIGIFGMILLIFLFLELLKMIWQVFDGQKENSQISFLFISLLIYIGWVLSYSLFDVVLLNDKVLLVFVVWLAIINNFYKQKRDEKSK